MTGCWMSGLPNATRWLAHLKHSSTIPRMPAMMYEMIIHRSCDREKK